MLHLFGCILVSSCLLYPRNSDEIGILYALFFVWFFRQDTIRSRIIPFFLQFTKPWQTNAFPNMLVFIWFYMFSSCFRSNQLQLLSVATAQVERLLKIHQGFQESTVQGGAQQISEKLAEQVIQLGGPQIFFFEIFRIISLHINCIHIISFHFSLFLNMINVHTKITHEIKK